jgi:hypothetical protein
VRTIPLRDLLDKRMSSKEGKSSGGSSSSSSSIEVMQGTGNQRQGSISSFPREVEQCVLDITSWYKTQSERSGDVRNVYGESLGLCGVGESDWKVLDSLYDSQAFPDSLRMLLTKCHGQLYLYEFQLLTIDQVCSKSEKYELRRKNWFPVGQDIDETVLMIDLKSGCVFSCDLEEPEEREELARSFGSYLEGLRDKLLAHKLEFIEDSGLVEVVGGQSPTRSGQSGRK